MDQGPLTPRSLSKVFQDATDPILVEDLNGVVIAANREAVRLYGWTEEELAGQPIKQIVPPDRHHQADELLERCRAGQEVRDVEGVRWTKDGRRIPSLITLSLLQDEDGSPIGIASFVKDITPLKRAQAELEAQVAARTAELVAANERLERELRVAREASKEAKRRANLVLLGESIAVQGLRQSITLHAGHEQPVLITGPPAAGQAVVAQAIHMASPHAQSRFVHVDCAHLQASEELAGKLDLAIDGTLYLEGIETLTPGRQLELYELLEEGTRGVRLLASVSGEVLHMIQQRSLDADLVDHLGRQQLRVPGLSERREDVAQIANAYLSQRARTLGKSVEYLDDVSRQRLLDYAWPGNLVELRGVLDRALSLAKGGKVDVSALLEGVSSGPRVAGYALTRCLGRGGMGEVWLARHDLLVRPAAVKLIAHGRKQGSQDLSMLEERFRREARATAELASPHTVQIYDFGATDQGSFYYVMEYLVGYDLHDLVQRFGRLPPARALALLAQACYSLEEAHGHGLIHRDVKPSNLFLCRLGPHLDFIKVLDFGLVRKLLDESTQTALTGAGISPGTPATMAPEVLGTASSDARSDIYALGCVAYWLLSGERVFEAPSPVLMIKRHLHDEPQPLNEREGLSLPAELDALVLSCLAKDPDARPQSCRELRERLLELSLPPWTQDDAERWWSEHPPEAPTSQPLPPSDRTATLVQPPQGGPEPTVVLPPRDIEESLTEPARSTKRLPKPEDDA